MPPAVHVRRFKNSSIADMAASLMALLLGYLEACVGEVTGVWIRLRRRMRSPRTGSHGFPLVYPVGRNPRTPDLIGRHPVGSPLTNQRMLPWTLLSSLRSCL